MGLRKAGSQSITSWREASGLSRLGLGVAGSAMEEATAGKATEGSILKAKSTLDVEEVGSIIGFVTAMGPDAYSDKSRFPSGPYCEVGDFIVMRSYSGTRFMVKEGGIWQEFRLINDDSVEAVVEDPTGVRKI